MNTLMCEYCGYAICLCNNIYNNAGLEGYYAGAYIAPASPTFPPSQNLPPQHMEDRYTAASPQGAGPFPYYNVQEQQHFRYSSGRVVDWDLINTFADGQYAYGQNNEQDARFAQRLAAFNHSFIQENDTVATPREAVFEPEEDLLHDGTVDPMTLSLPVVGGKVTCPECRVLLKDEKSLSRHISRTHNPNVEFHKCPEDNCDYSTKKKADLGRHARSSIHNKDVDPKPFKCCICGVGSSRKDNLKRHEETCARKALNGLSSQ
ncbi:hypothetical protein Vi05172_g880 [Venturia inaequalis]|uniref:C2H2-type domain-containing protein n=1 Tax=Venturia inaequalis TaxID=5025 RepID=A0A8H3ZBR8_VENIN|nr:hypothetical protein EG327_003710 [Venturia inaequalis]RDI89623.1 hypothetical protein Vi05172_g880 [Venturia inaequalis]